MSREQEVSLLLGRDHPSAHGLMRIALRTDGDTVTWAEPQVGTLHRGAEKLFEVRDYRQGLVLANRHDWLSAFSNELGLAMVCERMLGMDVPPRAIWLRTLLAELNRVLSHLAFLGGAPLDHPRLRLRCAGLREQVQEVMEEFSGGRVHFMSVQVGGLKQDVPLGWPRRVRSVVVAVRSALAELTAALHEVELPWAHHGVVSVEQVDQLGLSGPLARGSGVALDLRLDKPYLAYPHLDLESVTRPAGDCLARFDVLLGQLRVSLGLIEQCLDALPGGPVSQRLPTVLRLPEGSAYAWTEGPIGIIGYYLVSRGDRVPWRLKLRTPSFNNIQVLAEVLPGLPVSSLGPVLASLFFVVGDIDR